VTPLEPFIDRTIQRASLIGILSALLLAGTEARADWQTALSVGAEYRSGDYGDSEDIDDLYVPVSIRLAGDELAFQLTVPYVSVEGPAGSLVIPGDTIVGSGREVSESGVGDLVASVTLKDLYSAPDGNQVVDLTGTVKLGTADEADGLGTGENDYSLQMDFYHFYTQGTLFAAIGYKVRGDSSQFDLRDTIFAQTGGVYRVAAETDIGAAVSYRPKVVSSGDSASEVMLFANQILSRDLQVSGYGLFGLSDGSPDWGAGFSVNLWL